jgi:hypothetical protein
MTFNWRFRVPGIPNMGRALDRVVATAQNGLEVIRLGGLETGTQPSPYQIVDTERMYQLRRYFPDDVPDGPPVVLVHPMMMSANLFDVTPRNGAVSILRAAGLDPWVVDFGSPDKVEGGMDRTLADHIVATSEVIDRVRAVTNRDVPSRRLLAGWHVLLPDRGIPPFRRHRQPDHLRQPRGRAECVADGPAGEPGRSRGAVSGGQRFQSDRDPRVVGAHRFSAARPGEDGPCAHRIRSPVA